MSEFTARQLQHFLAIVDHGSVTDAADESYISQSAMSMSLRQLENTLGRDLFIRHKSRKMVPTQAGMKLIPHARRVVEEMEAAHAAVRGDETSMGGVVRVGTLPTLSPVFLPQLVAVLEESHPEVTVRLIEDTPAGLQTMIRRGELDVAFIYRRLFEHDLVRKDLISTRMHLMMPGDHPLARRSELSITEITDLPLILHDITPTADVVLGILVGMSVDIPVRIRSSNMETIREFVGMGLGFCLTNTVPGSWITSEGRAVAYVPVSDQVAANAICAVLPPGHVTSVRTTRVIAIAEEHLRKRTQQLEVQPMPEDAVSPHQ